MRLTDRVKSISHLKAKAPEMIRAVDEDREPLVITVRGEARAVLQDVASYEQTQETLALLKILALTNQAVEAGDTQPVDAVFARLRERLKR